MAPPELVILTPRTTLKQLRMAAQKAFRDVYKMFEHVEVYQSSEPSWHHALNALFTRRMPHTLQVVTFVITCLTMPCLFVMNIRNRHEVRGVFRDVKHNPSWLQILTVDGLNTPEAKKGRVGACPDGTTVTLHGQGADPRTCWHHAGALCILLFSIHLPVSCSSRLVDDALEF